MQIKQNIISNKRRKLVMYDKDKLRALERIVKKFRAEGRISIGYMVDAYIHGVNLDIDNKA